jgi:hypothetical protein
MGGETGGLGLRAWRRLPAVGRKIRAPAAAPASERSGDVRIVAIFFSQRFGQSGASGMFRRACPLTRARCAPLPPALTRRRPPSEKDARASCGDARTEAASSRYQFGQSDSERI